MLRLVVHGGAGNIGELSESEKTEHAVGIRAALEAGYTILCDGGAALDAVAAAVASLEDCPLFNAGRGSVLNHAGSVEMEAALMNGHNLDAGAVLGVSSIKNPILAARAVMENSRHAILSGSGAESFAKEQRLEMAEADYFLTDKRKEQLRRVSRGPDNGVELDHSVALDSLGTVGAVALDSRGHLAAATSTGGMTNKAVGRVGDSGLIGAGTYANEMSAVSCTGHGEFFVRAVAAHTLTVERSAGKALEEAARTTIEKVQGIGGEGGLIAVDCDGNIAMLFNTTGMYRGFVNEEGDFEIPQPTRLTRQMKSARRRRRS